MVFIEKLFEELLIGDNVGTTEHPRILKAKEDCLSKEVLNRFIEDIAEITNSGDTLKLKSILKEAVAGFTPDEEIVDVLYLQKNK